MSGLEGAAAEVPLDPAAKESDASKSVPYLSPLSIAASEFRPDGYEAGEVLVALSDGVMYGGNYNASRVMHAPVWLPDGVTITSVNARVIDSDAGVPGGGPGNCDTFNADMELWLYRSKGCTGSTCWDEMLNANTSSSSLALQFLPETSVVDHALVDNDMYQYYVMMRLCGPKHQVYGVRISYTEP